MELHCRLQEIEAVQIENRGALWPSSSRTLSSSSNWLSKPLLSLLEFIDASLRSCRTVLKEKVGLGNGPPVEPPIVSGDAPVHNPVGGIIEATGARMNTGASSLPETAFKEVLVPSWQPRFPGVGRLGLVALTTCERRWSYNKTRQMHRSSSRF